jgi:predicted RNA binding protein YcfA (HicA-like mRNA interferase family)
VSKSLTPKKVIGILKKNGFLFKRSKGSHFIFQHPVTKRRIIVPYHSKDLPTGTLISILKQAGISKNDL